MFCAICACLALCDGTLGGVGEGTVGGIRGGRGGDIGGDEAFCLFETLSSGDEVLAEDVGLAVAGSEKLGELCV